MKKLTVLLAMLLVAALLVGCTPKAPEATATPAPVVTDAPAAPTATPATNG